MQERPGVIAALGAMADLRADGVSPYSVSARSSSGRRLADAAPRGPRLPRTGVYYVGQPVRHRPGRNAPAGRRCRDLVSAQYDGTALRGGRAPRGKAGAPLVWAEATRNIAAEAAYGRCGRGRQGVRGGTHITDSSCTTSAWRGGARARCSSASSLTAARHSHAEPDPSGARGAAGRGVPHAADDFRVVVGDIGGLRDEDRLAPEDVLVCYAAKSSGGR